MLSTVHSRSRFTLSNALVRSMKARYKFRCCSRHFSCNRRATNIISTVLRPRPLSRPRTHNLPTFGPTRYQQCHRLFEHCVLRRFQPFLVSSDNQLGFKKGTGCNFAIRTVRNVVDSYIKGGNTANICAIDLSKAFDKVNHRALP